MDMPPLGAEDDRSGDAAAPVVRNDSDTHALRLILDGSASSRGELRRQLGLSASTVSSIVRRLIDRGLIEEVGSGDSTGGRRPVRLQALRGDTAWLVAELGGEHVRLGLTRVGGDQMTISELAVDVLDGPGPTLETIRAGWESLLAEHPGTAVAAAAIGLPGPVSAVTGELTAPARMPGWHGTRPGHVLSEALGVPVVAENDARAAALGEYVARASEVQTLIYVKAGSGIGGAYIQDGTLVHGGSGVAGDITHVPVPDAGDQACACGRIGCLETVASGAAIRRELQAKGIETSSVGAVVDLAVTFEPAATSAVRRSGRHLGDALSPLVNFLNPSAVLIGGSLSGIDAFVAAVRSAIYDSSLAMNTQDLRIEAAIAGPDAALIGLTRLAQQTAALPQERSA